MSKGVWLTEKGDFNEVDIREVHGLELLLIVGDRVVGNMSIAVICAALELTVFENTGSH